IAAILIQAFVYHLDPSEFSLVLFLCCVIHYWLSRSDSPHLAAAPVAIAILLPFALFSTGGFGSRGLLVPKGTAVVAIGVAILLFWTAETWQATAPDLKRGLRVVAAALVQRMNDSDRLSVSSSSPVLAVLYPNENELRAVRFVRANTARSEPVFV